MPARTGARSRAVDDRDRSSSSSDPGSAIEGFRQKIPLHNKLADLGVKLGDLASSATVSWPLMASSATLALNSAENRLRVLMVVRPLHLRIHLSRLSQ